MNSTAAAHFSRCQIVGAAAALGLVGSEPSGTPNLIAALCKPDITLREVARLATLEPFVYAKILRVANSSFYGQSREVKSLERAVMILGFDAVRGIAAAACLDRAVRQRAAPPALSLRSVLHHCLATAAVATLLARRRCPDLEAEAFVAGLLHNLGVAVQSRLDPHAAQRLMRRLAMGPLASIRDLECDCGLIGHEPAMAQVYEEWGLPEALIESTRHHHACEHAPERFRRLAALVGLSAHLASSCGYRHPFEPEPSQPREQDLRQLGLQAAEVEPYVSQLPGWMETLQGALLDG